MIPYFKPTYTQESRDAVACALKADTKPGQFVHAFEHAIAEKVGIDPAQVMATNSCTAALQLAAYGHYRHRGYEEFNIQAPVLTWPSTWAWCAPRHRVLVDVDKRTLLPQFSSTSHSLYYVVDLYGCGMDAMEINEVVKGRPFVLDAAHNLFAVNHRKLLQMPTCMGICYSFFHTKQISTIRGGALLLPKHMRDGTRVSLTARRDSGTIGRQLCEDQGWNFEMEDVNASLGLQQIKLFDMFKHAAQGILKRYRASLTTRDVSVLGQSGHLAVLRTRTVAQTKQVQAALKAADVAVGQHYPVHTWFKTTAYPNAFHISKRITTLPCYPSLTNTEQETVIEAVKKALNIGRLGGRALTTDTIARGQETKPRA